MRQSNCEWVPPAAGYGVFFTPALATAAILMVFVGENKKKNPQIKNLHQLTVFSPTIEIMCANVLTSCNVFDTISWFIKIINN